MPLHKLVGQRLNCKRRLIGVRLGLLKQIDIAYLGGLLGAKILVVGAKLKPQVRQNNGCHFLKHPPGRCNNIFESLKSIKFVHKLDKYCLDLFFLHFVKI